MTQSNIEHWCLDIRRCYHAPPMPEIAAYFKNAVMPLNDGRRDLAASKVTLRRPIRMVALDLDGTCLRTDKCLSDATIAAVKACAERGVKVVLASARPPRSCKAIHEQLGLATQSIHYNGALIHDFRGGRHVFHQPMEAAVAKRLIKAARKLDPDCLVSLEILDRWYTDRVDPAYTTETGREFNPDFVGHLDAFLTVPVTKVMLLAPPARTAKLAEMVRRRFKGKVGMAVSDKHLIQLMHREVDKAAALAQVAAEYGIHQEEVMAIGDAPNDRNMLKWAGLGVAVGNAWPMVIQAADVVVPPNDADGVAHAIERFVLV